MKQPRLRPYPWRTDRCCAAILILAVLGTVRCVSPTVPPQISVEEARRRVVLAPRVSTVAGAAEVPLIGTQALPLVEIHLNGRGPYRFLLDTGANVTILQTAIANELRLPILRPGAASQLLHLDRLGIGRAEFRDLVIGARSWSEPIDGILGFNVFKDVLLTIDTVKRSIRIERGQLPPADHSTRVPLIMNERHHPFVKARIGAQSVDFMLDTGAGQAVTIPSAIARSFELQDVRPGPTLSSEMGKSQTQLARLSDPIVVGTWRKSGAEVHVTQLESAEEDVALLGFPYLAGRRITIDQRNAVLLILPASPDF